MIRILEPLFFGSVAIASHVALFVAAPVGMPPASGDDGRAVVTLAAAPQGMTEMVEAWTAPPQTMTEVAMPAPEAAIPDAQQAAPRADSAPRPALPAPQMAMPQAQPDSPAIDTAPAARPAPKTRPKAKPAPKAQATAKPSQKTSQPKSKSGTTPRAAQKAAGAGNKGNAGKNGKAKVATKKAANSPKALAKWHAGIRTRIERKKRAPRNCHASGTATLRLKIATSGQLVGLALLKSSGNGALDKAALTAAKGARLPAAPRGVTGATSVNLPIRFNC